MSSTVSVVLDGEVCTAKNPRVVSGPNVRIDPRTGDVIPDSNLEMSITGNYHVFYRRKQMFGKKGIDWLDGKKCKDTIKKLISCSVYLLMLPDGPYIDKARKHHDELEKKGFGNGPFKIDYWTPIPSNAKKAIDDLVYLAHEAPYAAVWRVSE
jgi:hypothetical protein